MQIILESDDISNVSMIDAEFITHELINNKITISLYSNNTLFLYHKYYYKNTNQYGQWYRSIDSNVLNIINNTLEYTVDNFENDLGQIKGKQKYTIKFTKNGLDTINTFYLNII